MTNRTIPQLPRAGKLTGPEAVPLFQNGITSWASAQDIANLVMSAGYAYGEIILTAGSTPITLTASGTWYPIASGWSNDLTPHNMTVDASNGTMTIATGGAYATLCTVAFTSTSSPAVIQFNALKNGNVIPDHTAVSWTDSTLFPNTISMTGIDVMVPGDVVSLSVQAVATPGINVTPTYVNFSIYKVGP